MSAGVDGPQEKIVAFLDLGTNSIRMLLVRFNANHSFTILSEEKQTVRLGEGEFRRHQLQPEAMRRAAIVCQQFAQTARNRGASEVVAVATSATREAENRSLFVRRLQKQAGIDVRVISGKEEARLIYLGVASGTNLGGRKALFIDIGGGSTETIVGDQQRYSFLDSLPLGAIRLTGAFLRKEDVGPIAPARYQRMIRYVQTRSARTLDLLKQQTYDMVIGSSGTIMHLLDVTIRNEFKRPWKRDDVVTRTQLRNTVQMLCALSLEERRKVPGLNPERADIIVPGAAILETLVQELGITELSVSDRGLREGLPIDYLSRWEHPHFIQNSFRERSVLELGHRCQFDELHARRIVRLAWQLFDSAKELGLHAFGDWERELLEHAALLHDVGSFVSYNHHRCHSYYVIRNADLLGFDQTEIDIIATVALFHHKAFPRPKHPEYALLDGRSRNVVRTLCVFLQLAESLDRGHVGAVREAKFAAADRKQVVLEIRSRQNCHLEMWELHQHENAFEKVFARQLKPTLIVEPTDADTNTGPVEAALPTEEAFVPDTANTVRQST